jgi:hypothetical protein
VFAIVSEKIRAHYIVLLILIVEDSTQIKVYLNNPS